MRTRSVLALCLGIPLLAVGGFAAFVGTHDSREAIDLASVVGDTAWDREMTPGARVATDEICDAELPCVQAVDARTLTLLKFRTEEEAAHVAESYGGDSHLSGWIVVRYKDPGLTAAQREEFEDSLDCVNVGIGPEGQEC